MNNTEKATWHNVLIYSDTNSIFLNRARIDGAKSFCIDFFAGELAPTLMIIKPVLFDATSEGAAAYAQRKERDRKWTECL